MQRTCFQTATLLFLLATRTAVGEVVLDQQNDVTGSATADSTNGGITELAQTFTVGITGTLNRVEVQLARFFGSGGDMVLSIYNTSGGLPIGPSLGSKSLPWTVIPSTGYDYQVFDLNSVSIPATAGTVMAFVLSSTSGGATGGPRNSFTLNSYPGGEAQYRTANSNDPWQAFPNSHDYGFKIYVDIAEPMATPGDFNDDGAVDAADYIVWRKNFNNPSEVSLNGNGDNMNGVDDGDYTLWRTRFGTTDSGSGGAVPEPAAITLSIFAVGALGAITRNRRCRA